MATAGLVLASSGVVMLSGTAANADPPDTGGGPGGNNGSVKVNSQDLTQPDNEPHLPCQFKIEWFDFDGGDSKVVADVYFTVQAPTDKPEHHITVARGATHLTFDGGSGLNHEEWYKLVFAGKAAGQGYHVDLRVKTTDSNGSIDKSKTYWIDPCQATPQEPTVTQSTTCDVQGSYSVPATEGVDYLLDGTKLTAGTVYPGPKTGTITAEAQDGYVLTNPNWQFKLSVAAAKPCPVLVTGTPVSPAVTPVNGCDTFGSIAQPAGGTNVTYTLDGKSTGWGTAMSGTHTVVATLTGDATEFKNVPQGWVVDGSKATLTIDLGQHTTCPAVTGTPVSPDITHVDGCGTSGSIARPAGGTNVTYTLDGKTTGWGTDMSGTHTVVATLTGDATEFKDVPEGWDVTGNTATLTIDLGKYTDCEQPPGETTGELGTPQFTAITRCGQYGSITEMADANNVAYTIDGGENWAVQQGSHTITATLVNGATSFTGSTAGWTVAEGGKSATRTVNLGTYETCPTPPGEKTGQLGTPQYTAITECGQLGSITELADADNVAYTIDGGEDWSATTGTHTITATLINGATSFTGSTAGWTVAQDGKSATTTVELGAFTACPVPTTEVTPAAPTFTEPSCENPDGAAAVYADTDAVDYSQTGTVAQGGTVTVTAVPKAGYAFPEGFVASWSHTFTAGIVCGTETIKPRPTKHVTPVTNPSKQPTVLGTEAVAVPTAVDAGLATWGGDTQSAPGNGLLAQAMVAVGLVLLLAGGWLGMGRRRRGVHQF